jgi:hypothetical protein
LVVNLGLTPTYSSSYRIHLLYCWGIVVSSVVRVRFKVKALPWQSISSLIAVKETFDSQSDGSILLITVATEEVATTMDVS